MKYLLILLLVYQTALAQDPVYLNKNQPAPFEGYLIDQMTADKARANKIDLDAQTRIVTLQQQEMDLLNQRINNSQAEMNRLSKELVSARDANGWNKMIYFLLGAAATTAIAYGAVKAVQ